MVIEVALKVTWETPYLDGIKLSKDWDKFIAHFAKVEKEGCPGLPKAIFATDMRLRHL